MHAEKWPKRLAGPETLENRRALCSTLPIYLNAEDSASSDVQHEELQAYSLLAGVQSSSGVSAADSAAHPSVQSFVINTSNERGSSTDSDIHHVVSGYEADVQSVLYTEQATYVLASGVPSYPVGPWPDGNPAVATDRSWVFSITHNPQEQTGIKTAVDLGNIGVYVNGVPIYDAQDGMSWNNEGQWHQNAVYFEADGFDNALGHPSPIMGSGGGGGLPPPPDGGGGGGLPPPPDGGGGGLPPPPDGGGGDGSGFVDGAYHHHQNPVSLRDQLGDDGSGHSPILGWAFDGFPIYGPYGFANSDGSGGVVRLDSSYQLKSGVRPSGPGGSYDGAYIEDFSFVSGSGALDEHNGRFAVTPEYPSGTYYYVATVDASGQAAYPYAIGPTYYGVIDAANKSQSVTVPSTAVAYDPSAPVNEAPTAVAFENTTSTLPEDTATDIRKKLTDIVVTDDALGTNSLSLSGTDAASFEIIGLSLYLKAGVALNHEVQSLYAVTVSASDSSLAGSSPVTANFLLTVTNVNEAPTAVAFVNVTSTLPEDTATDTRKKLADIVVTDDALGTNSLSLSGTDATSFEIIGASLYLKAGVALDHEVQSLYAVTASASDSSLVDSSPVSANFMLTVTNANKAPTAVAFENTTSTLPEDTATNTRKKLAGIVVTDDALGTNSLSLSGMDAASFEIIGASLYLKAAVALDYEAKGSHVVTVVASDSSIAGSSPVTADFTLTVTDVNEAPSAVGFENVTSPLPENSATDTRKKLADIVVTDDALGTNILSLSGTDAGSFEIDGTALYLKAGVTLDYEARGSYVVTVSASDSSLVGSSLATANFTLSVTDVNEAPTAVRLTNAVTSLPESTATTNGAFVADIVVDDDGLGFNALSLSAADAGLFEIRGLQLYLKAGVNLVARAGTTLLVTVAVADSTLPDQAAVMTSLELSIVAETPRLTVTAGGEVYVNSVPLTAAGAAVREAFRLWTILEADVVGDQAFVRAQHTSGKTHRLFADISAEAWTLRGGLHGVGNSGSIPLDRSARGDAFSLTTGFGSVSSIMLPPLVSLGGGLLADDLGRLYTEYGVPMLEQDRATALQVSSLENFHPIAIGRISAERAWKYSLLWQKDDSHEFIEWQLSSEWVYTGVSRKSNESLVELEAAYGTTII